ncbi:MAG: hypothetical protein WBC22_17185 [Sedimentisphaerales bacterium]
MSNNNSNSKKTFFCVYGIIVLSFLEAHTIAFGQIRLDDTIYNLKGEKAYEKRNAEITPWVEDGTPPNPGNAALLYYQAFLLRPEPNEAISNKIHEVSFGAEPDRQVRKYLGSCLDVIEIVEIASRMQQCTWGVWVKPVFLPSHGALRREIYSIYEILLMDARILAADGHYRVALERCLTALRIARHFREDPELYTFSTPLERYALRMVRYVLGVMPPDADILTWFRGQLSVVKGAPPSYAKSLQARIKADLKHIRTYPARLARLRNLLVVLAEDEQAKENARNLTDEQFLLCTSRGLQSFLDPIFRILDSEITYEQKRAEMQRIVSNLTEVDDTDPVTKDILIMINMRGTINIQYPSYVEHHAYINGVKVAVEVYLVVAKTGRLPETLPEGLPKDPSTGQDFVYEITAEGFALRCQDEKFLSRYSRRLEFKVKK